MSTELNIRKDKDSGSGPHSVGVLIMISLVEIHSIPNQKLKKIIGLHNWSSREVQTLGRDLAASLVSFSSLNPPSYDLFQTLNLFH